MTAEFHPARGRLNGSGPVAVVDIGSNSVRLVIYERKARTPTMLFNEKLLAGLGKGIAATGRLADDSVSLALGELTRFKTLIKHTGCQDIYIVATAAARDAENGPDFVREVERFLEAPVRILDGNEEAYYSALGVIAGFWQPRGIVGDMGAAVWSWWKLPTTSPARERRSPLAGCGFRKRPKARSPRHRRSPKRLSRTFSGLTWLPVNGHSMPLAARGGRWAVCI